MGLKIKHSKRLGADLQTIQDINDDITQLQKIENSKEREKLGFSIDDLKEMSDNLSIDKLEESSLVINNKTGN